MSILSRFKKKDEPSKSVKEVPLARVEELVGKGLSKRQIIDFLKSEGYSVDLIEKAFSQVSAKKGVMSNTGAPVSEELPPLEEELPPLPGEEPLGAEPLPELPPNAGLESLEPEVEEDISKVGDVEGLIEVIIEEKFAEMIDKLEGLDELKESVEARIDSFKSDIDDMKERLEGLEKFREESMSSHKQTLDDIRLEMDAMEKAFHKLVPTLSANIRQLREMKGSKSKESNKKEKELVEKV
jgi:hypothetical protein